MLTACGIETPMISMTLTQTNKVATVLTACGIETLCAMVQWRLIHKNVATVLTACGIETEILYVHPVKNDGSLQQCLPLAVLKREEA